MNIRVQQLENCVRALTAEKTSLTEANTMLQRKISSLGTELSTHKVAMRKKNDEVRVLHGIIQKNCQSKDFTDEEIIKRFGDLCHNILRVVASHFSKQNPRTKSSSAAQMIHPDYGLYLRSFIAQTLFDTFFRPDRRLFGLDIDEEKAQQELETRLYSRGVPEAEIKDWRIALVKAAMKMDDRKKRNYPLVVAEDILNRLEDGCIIGDKKSAQKDMNQLCFLAWETALLLCTSRSVYEWHQCARTYRTALIDVELIGPFNVQKDSTTPITPVMVLFGPLYKVVDGDRILLRQGDVLNGN